MNPAFDIKEEDLDPSELLKINEDPFSEETFRAMMDTFHRNLHIFILLKMEWDKMPLPKHYFNDKRNTLEIPF